jgi:hypothetical protein
VFVVMFEMSFIKDNIDYELASAEEKKRRHDGIDL